MHDIHLIRCLTRMGVGERGDETKVRKTGESHVRVFMRDRVWRVSRIPDKRQAYFFIPLYKIFKWMDSFSRKTCSSRVGYVKDTYRRGIYDKAIFTAFDWEWRWIDKIGVEWRRWFVWVMTHREYNRFHATSYEDSSLVEQDLEPGALCCWLLPVTQFGGTSNPALFNLINSQSIMQSR